ncbi:hypothetical protein EJ110_NYTH27748 [Nymphaea thermarum]|nr:hypothetical protein EJ110_NYTH27748 [Nymphaea thermarum]
MATPLPSLTIPSSSSLLRSSHWVPRNRTSSLILRCDSTIPGSTSDESAKERAVLQNSKASLGIGSPIVVIEAPPALKTADSMPSLKMNTGQIKPGDVGRIVARKPKDVWAVRLAAGTYLMDAKYFTPLDLEE